MNPHTVSTVQSSWKLVLPIAPQAAEIFYGRLFALDPTLRKLFKGDMNAQGARLMQMIGMAVERLNDLDALVPVLYGLGQRHSTYGVVPAHYDTVGTALLETLTQGLGDHFTPATRLAWTEVYTLIAQVMMTATEQESPAV